MQPKCVRSWTNTASIAIAASEPEGDLTLDRYQDTASILGNRKVWLAVAERLAMTRTCRPRGNRDRQPSSRQQLADWIQRPTRGGRTPAAARSGPGDDSPAQSGGIQQHDPRSGGARLSAGRRFSGRRRRLRIRQHRRRAVDAADAAGKIPGGRPIDRRPGHRRPSARPAPIANIEARQAEVGTGGQPYGNSAWQFSSRTAACSTVLVRSATGGTSLKITAFGQQAGPEPARMAVDVDGKTIGLIDVVAVEAEPQGVRTPAHISRPANTG